ncbi:MAG: hypothetical protein ACETWT_08550 [Thermodesulfobacteriota bacterium]
MPRGANPERLAEICRRILGDMDYREEVGELNPSWFSGKGRIGVVGGALTPGWVIEEIVEGMHRMVSQCR